MEINYHRPQKKKGVKKIKDIYSITLILLVDGIDGCLLYVYYVNYQTSLLKKCPTIQQKSHQKERKGAPIKIRPKG